MISNQINTEAFFDVVGFGTAIFDYICIVDRVSTYRKQANISSVKFFGGGCVPTALVTLQKLGLKTSMFSFLGDDWISNEILNGLKEEGVDCSYINIIKNTISTFSFIQVNKNNGKRAISYFPGTGELLKFNSDVKNFIKKGKILFIDSLSPLEKIEAAIFAHENRIKVMLDAHSLSTGIKDLLYHVDYLITSESFLFEFTKNKDIESSIRMINKIYKPEILITTLGKNGSITLINNQVVQVEIFDVNVKDTTGCGDVYHGASLFGIIKKWNLKDIMIFATAVASIKSTAYGGRAGIPDLNSTLQFLKKQGLNTNRFC